MKIKEDQIMPGLLYCRMDHLQKQVEAEAAGSEPEKAQMRRLK